MVSQQVGKALPLPSLPSRAYFYLGRDATIDVELRAGLLVM
jgi:hypothetical protein